MLDYSELMRILSRPRPNGSIALDETRQAVLNWLDGRQIPYHIHSFRSYPNLFVATGLWLIFSRTLLALAIWLRWGWATLIIALFGLLGGLVDVAFHIPLISWVGAIQGQNILIEFDPEKPRQEIILSAHYDSKTELLDHYQRMFFLKNLRLGMGLTILLGFLGPLDKALLGIGSPWAGITYGIGILVSLFLLFLAWGLGLNLSMGRWRSPSQGAVDNGAACAILLGLARRAAQGKLPLQCTRLRLALFTGEEVNMQGSRAYAASRDWPLPAMALNLEVMAQDGDYVFWEEDGTALRLVPTSPEINQAIAATVAEVVGSPARPAGPVNSDGGSFLFAGIPSTTLGTYDLRLGDRGFHLPSDNLNRVVMDRLPQGEDILARFVMKIDNGELKFPSK